MTTSNIGRNIKRLRELRSATQEELAQALSVTAQAVSKWENDVSVPDTLTLPAIAGFFGVAVDDLFRPEVNAYANNAQRLLAVYEASHDRNDFIRADAEFKKLFDSGEFTRDDVRAYGVLNEYQMYDCRDIALRQYEQVLAGPERDEAARGARQQRLFMLSRIGRGERALEEERARFDAAPEDPENRLALTAALYWTGRYEEVLELCAAARGDEPLAGMFALYAGDACRKLGRFDQAFSHWERAAKLTPDAADPLFSMAFCLHVQGKYGEEAAAWERVIDWLAGRGYVHELTGPRDALKKARELSREDR